MKLRTIIFCLITFSLSQVFAQQAQDSTQLMQITINDGNSFIGFIISESETDLQFKTFSYGQITLRKALIQKTEALDSKEEKRAKKKAEKKSIVSDTTSVETVWHIVTRDGFDFVGTILSENEMKIELQTEKFGNINIQKQTIKTIIPVKASQIIEGDAWVDNPQGTRYFYHPNGYGLKKGEGYYQNVWVLFNQASLGLSKNFSMGVGTVPVFLFGAGVVPIWITPKFSFPIIKDKLNLGAGAFLGSIIGGGEGGFGIVYGVATYGSRDKNVTGGIGYFFSDDGMSKYPTLSFSTMLRTGKKTYFISENYAFNGVDLNLVVISAGFRTVWPRLSLDYGLAMPISNELDSFIATPWLGFVIPFGNVQY